MGFGAATTTDEVTAGLDLSGRSALFTGASSGIGQETARALASVGAAVTLAVRNVAAGEQAASAIRAAHPQARLQVRPLDLASRSSVSAFVETWRGPLHVLVNNAGVMALPTLERTRDGWEMQFATNHLGHFALAQGLRGALAKARGARVVSVGSSAHLLSPAVLEDPHFDFVPYDPVLAYARSKTANILFAVEAARRWAGEGVTANALNPGAIATNLQRHRGGTETPPERLKTVRQGAATSVLLAASPAVEAVTGRYFEDCAEAPVVSRRGDTWAGVAPYALDAGNAARLWDLSLRLLDLAD